MTNKKVENFQQGGARNGAQGRGGEPSGASEQHRSNVPPFRLTAVTGDWLAADQDIPAYTNGVLWNGWQQPLFPTSSVRLIAQLMPAEVAFDEAAGVVRVTDEHEEPAAVFESSMEQIEVDGKLVDVFCVGSGWCWELAASEQGASERDKARAVLSGYAYQRVADLYDQNPEFANALRVLAGPEFEYPDYSYLLVRQAISKADRLFASGAASQGIQSVQHAESVEARTMDEGKTLLDQALTAIGATRTPWEERGRYVSPWEYCLVTLPNVSQAVSVGVSAGGVVSVSGVPFSPNGRKLNVWVEEILASLAAWRDARAKANPPLEFVRTDRDNCRVYYRLGGKLYAFQAERKDHFQLFECTPDGEPMYPVPLKPVDQKPTDYPEFGRWADLELARNFEAVAVSSGVAAVPESHDRALVDCLCDLVQAVEFLPLGVRGIKAVHAAKMSLGKVPGTGYSSNQPEDPTELGGKVTDQPSSAMAVAEAVLEACQRRVEKGRSLSNLNLSVIVERAISEAGPASKAGPDK
ncbi:hypothetical protein [Ralstonia insidiosa]|jgi:hypothetical protein|nr:hypothetical protein [Ralstonia insidiosa]MBA9939270.1 hypothetical protein [Ralstonia insidiosa]MBC9968043.1 hypothetical protein [Ralstonia insidiosa]MBX3904394.1 hypothetical protein [Ralstonia insidiosa]